MNEKASPGFVVSQKEPHLGGNIREGDAYSYCPSVWNYVIDRFCIASAMDLGSGIGDAARFFFRRGLMTVAIEGLAENVARSFYPALCHDLRRGAVATQVDLVHCQEVVEHIEERYLDNLLQSLACGRVILMTHGVPGQEGHHHVNLQLAEYWIRNLSARDYLFLDIDTDRIRALAAQDGAQYMRDTGLLFHKKG